MPSLWGSVSFRIALVYGVLVIGSMAVISGVFYYGTVVVQARGIDTRLEASSGSLSTNYKTFGLQGLRKEIAQLLGDGIDQDTEVYLLLDTQGHRLAGNLSIWPTDDVPFGIPSSLEIRRPLWQAVREPPAVASPARRRGAGGGA